MLPQPADALQRVVVQDERTQTLAVSSTALTVVQLPAPVLQAVSSQPGLEIKAREQTVIVAPVTAPADLVVLAGQYAYVFRLEPDPARGPDTVVIEDRRIRTGTGHPRADAADLESEDDSTGALIELSKLGLTGRWPVGVTGVPLAETELPRWLELRAVQAEVAVVRRGGHDYEIRRLVLENDTPVDLSLRETEFYGGDELAIALDRQVVAPHQQVVVSLVRLAPPPATEDEAGAGPTSNPDPEAVPASARAER